MNRVRRSMHATGSSGILPMLLLVLLSQPLGAVKLMPETIQAFDDYVVLVDTEFERRLQGEAPFLWATESSERSTQLDQGTIVIEAAIATGGLQVERGIIHDWIAATRIPRVSIERVVGIISAYNRHAKIFAPDVNKSHILKQDNLNYIVYMRLFRKKILTAIFDTEHIAQYGSVDSQHQWSRSYSTIIQEVQNAGTANEYLLPVGDDHGLLWRINTYWRFAQVDSDVIAECRSVALTRNIPAVLHSMLQPILPVITRNSLRNMMKNTSIAALHSAP